jgi:hypothetical protein
MPSVVRRAEAYELGGERARAARWQIIRRNPGITQLSATARYAQRQLNPQPRPGGQQRLNVGFVRRFPAP